MDSPAPQPLPVGLITFIGAAALLAGAGAGRLLYSAVPAVALATAPFVGAAVYVGVRVLVDADARAWLRVALMFGITVFASAYFVVLASESWHPAPTRDVLVRVARSVEILLRIIGGAALAVLIAAVAAWHSEGRQRLSLRSGALAPLAVGATLVCGSFLLTMTAFVVILATAPLAYLPYALVGLMLGLPPLAHGWWTFTYGNLLTRWEVEAMPYDLVEGLARLRERCHFTFDRVLCLDDSYGNARACAVTSTARTSTLVISARLATEFTRNELLAVLAHEAAHVELHHFRRKLMMGGVAAAAWVALVFAVDFALSFVLGAGLAVARMLVMAMSYGYLRTLFDSRVTRTHEREADEYAARAAGAEPVISALEKLGAHRFPFRVANRYTTHSTWEVRSAHLRRLANIGQIESRDQKPAL